MPIVLKPAVRLVLDTNTAISGWSGRFRFMRIQRHDLRELGKRIASRPRIHDVQSVKLEILQ